MRDKNIEEIVKILNKDFYKFASNFLYIRSKHKSISQFLFNKEQQYINKKLEEQKSKTGKVRSLILKGRQIGATTFVASRGYHYTLSNIGVKSLILTHRQTATNNIFDMILRYYNFSPDFLRPKALISNHQAIVFKDIESSYSFATAGSNEVGRSQTIQFFHGSEVAFWKNSDNHLSSILMSIPDDGGSEVILESTSNGNNGLFYNMCLEAEKDLSEYQLIFIPWYWHDEYISEEKILFSQEWLEYQKTHKLSKKQLSWAYLKNRSLCSSNQESSEKPSLRFHKEFPATVSEAFSSKDENRLIPLEKLLQKSLSKDFLNIKEYESIAYEFSNNLRRYPIVLGVDIARGGGDLSWIIDRQGDFLGFNVNEKINTSDTMYLVGLIAKYIDKLLPKKVCIDAGGGGIGVFDRLCELGYSDIVMLVNFASKAQDSRKYLNKRAEIWGLLKDFIFTDGYIVEDSLLLQQISSVEYLYTSNGQIKLESKEEIRKRLKGSPDGGDASALTFAYHGELSMGKRFHFQTKSLEDYQPFDW